MGAYSAILATLPAFSEIDSATEQTSRLGDQAIVEEVQTEEFRDEHFEGSTSTLYPTRQLGAPAHGSLWWDTA